jgi:DNA modification methylase
VVIGLPTEDEPVKVVCGDALSVLRELPAGSFDAVVTDPPYGILSAAGSAATRRSGGNITDGRHAWDIAPNAETLRVVMAAAPAVAIWGGCHLELPPTFGYLIWDKRIDGLNFGECEYCWTNARFAPRIWRERAVCVDGGKVHPTQKPIALMRWCLRFFPGANLILDPFAGSGTTGVAAVIEGRRALLIERDPAYADIARRRVAEALGRPTKLADGSMAGLNLFAGV